MTDTTHLNLCKPMQTLKTYEKACNDLAKAFLESFYDGQEWYDDSYWVGDEIGGVFSWGDWFTHMNNIADYFRYGYTPDKWIEWYDYCLETKEPMNMKHFIMQKKNR